MTGTKLLEALSFVDEKYIQEAENAKLRTGTPWMKILSVAACLCILLTGVYAFSRMQQKTAETEAAAPPMAGQDIVEEAAPAATAAAPEAALEDTAPAEAPTAAGAAPKQESGTEEHAAEEEGFSAAAGELEQIPFVRLEIIQILEEGKFTAVVDAVDENPTSVEAGMELTVVVDASKIPGADREIQNDLREITENIIVVVEDGAYDANANTLYVACLFNLAVEDRSEQ